MNAEQEIGAEGLNADGMQANGDVKVNGVEDHEVNVDAAGEVQQTLPIQGERLPNKERITTPYLTKYERARILGTRALQIRCVATAFVWSCTN